MPSDILLVSIVAILTSKAAYGNDIHPLSDEFIDAINKQQSLWKAGRNFKEDTPMSYIETLGACRLERDEPLLPELRHDLGNVEIPVSFDWRDHKQNCSTLRDIRDQGSCGSCWANAAAEVISDRICIHSNRQTDVYISVNDLISCCTACGDGCDGGWESAALRYWQDHGVVTGGPYNTNQGCRPYEIPPCEHHVDGPRPQCASMTNKTPQCKTTCRNGYSRSYKDDLHFAKSSYAVPGEVRQIQAEIVKNGPVTAAFAVFEDFVHYKYGVYKHTVGARIGAHAVKIVGWGVENDTPYWLVANSWNTDWGDKGYFKILRGSNHCGIEADISAGIPA